MTTPVARAAALGSLLIVAAGAGTLGWLPGVARAQEALILAGPGATLYREHCASCHDEGPNQQASRAPLRPSLAALSREAIVAALSPGGTMAPMATGMTAVERAAVAAFLSKTTAAVVDPTPAGAPRRPRRCRRRPRCRSGTAGATTRPTRASSRRRRPGLTAQSVPKLTLKWAFGLPGVIVVSAQPTVFGGRVIVGSESGIVYALDAATGCVRWQFKAGAGVRSAAVVGRLAGDGPARYAAYFGDLRATVYAVDLRHR